MKLEKFFQGQAAFDKNNPDSYKTFSLSDGSVYFSLDSDTLVLDVGIADATVDGKEVLYEYDSYFTSISYDNGGGTAYRTLEKLKDYGIIL